VDAITFRHILADNYVFINKIFKNRLVVPDFDGFRNNIAKLYHDLIKIETGDADAWLKKINHLDENHFGISVCTVDGQRFSIGDATTPFSLQSLVRPITYGITLNEMGDEVHEYQGREPSGRKFGEICLDAKNKPFNPYVNPGGIMSASLLIQKIQPELDDLARKYEYVHNIFQQLAGGGMVQFNNSLFLSEKTCMDQDSALAYFMRENNCFPPGADIKQILDFYCQLQCLEMDCESNSVMAATLANGGICPITEKRILKFDVVENVLNLMSSCGMGIFSGQFAFNIGLPAISSECGAIMLVIPKIGGITIFSPKLDRLRNSVRGVEFCDQLTDIYRFHKYDSVLTGSKIDPTMEKSSTSTERDIQNILASANGDLVYLQRAFLNNVDLNLPDRNGRTPLHLAAAEGHLECVKFLMTICQVDPDPKDRWHNSPLSEALRHRKTDVIEYMKTFSEEKNNLKQNGNPYQMMFKQNVTTI